MNKSSRIKKLAIDIALRLTFSEWIRQAFPVSIAFIYYFDALNFEDMPSKEYRILVNGKIVMRNWTKTQHIVWVDLYLDRGVEFTEEIVDLR